jgi:two-component system KDP operon response regulator KdpE
MLLDKAARSLREYYWAIPMRPPRALLLYEHDNNCELLRSVLTAEGYAVDEYPLGRQTNAPVSDYCLVLFDVQRLTDRFLDITRAWRDEASGTTLIMIGNRTTQAHRVALLESGVNAYLAKPLIVAELRARIRASLRRFHSQETRLRRFSFGEGIIDLEAHLIRVAGREIRLTPTECGILEHLASHINQTVPSNDLVKMLWGPDPQKGVHSIRRFISKLRQKLEPDSTHPRYLITEPAIGYRLQIPVETPGKSDERPA